MRYLAVSQSVAVVESRGERRDFLDQAWTRFLSVCGLAPLLVPNDPDTARAICDAVPICGILLTGGNNLAAYGGDARERDETEDALINIAEERALPLLGVCRGMQVIQQRFGVPLVHVTGHVAPRQTIAIEDRRDVVNSFHNFGATETRAPLTVWAVADDGVIKAVRHSAAQMMGIMWHPERFDPFAARDVTLFRQIFRVS